MRVLDKIIDSLGAGAWEEMDNAVVRLDEYQENGMITPQEHDALRHYFGLQAMAKEYGGSVAWIMGLVNEGLNLVVPGELGEQTRIDIKNNNIALDHVKRGVAVDLKNINTYDDLKPLLDVLIVPPPYKDNY